MLTLRPTAATQQDFQKRLAAIRSMVRPQPDLVEKVQAVILDGFSENFATESAGGARWAALAESTVLNRLQQGFSAGPVLHRTGDYESSWTDAGDENHVSEVDAKADGWLVAEGSQHPLAYIHQRGRGLPARPANELSAGKQAELRQAVDSFLFRTLFIR